MRLGRNIIASSIASIFSSKSTRRLPPPPSRKRFVFESLESRLLLSADPAAAGALLVIDGSLADQADLLDQFSASDVLVLDQDRDGLEQISQALAERSGDVSELHIVSHGWNGSLALGSTTLDAASLESHQAQLRAWADALTADADILFYGCNLAADDAGIGFVEKLSDLTGADIAASTDLTGAEGLGGNWKLEYATSSIEADAIAVPAGSFILAAPAGNDDMVATDEDVALRIAVLANDEDVDGDPLTVTRVFQSANGTVEINDDGTLIIYTPNPDFSGNDSFDYMVSDGQGGSDFGTVSVTVNAVNDAPVADDDAYATDEDVPLTVGAPGVLANDTDVDSVGLSATLETGPAHGTLELNANGSFTYTPERNYFGADSFKYTVNDGQGGSDTATVSLTVNAVNDAPAGNDDMVATDEDVALRIAVLANDEDVDGDPLTVTRVFQSSNSTVVINPDGTLTYTPNANFSGNDSFDYMVSDGQGGSDFGTVSVTVNAVNDAPVAEDDAYSTDEDTALTVSMPGVLTNDTDVDSSLTAVLDTGPAHGTLTLNANGSFTYTPNLNFNGTDSFIYRASDGQGGSDTATVSLTVNAVNDAPEGNDDTVATDEDVTRTIAVLANDEDADGDPLTVTRVFQSANSTVVINADGTLTYTPNANFSGNDSFDYMVSDGQGGSDFGTVSVTVNAVNDDPVAGDDAYATDEDTELTVAMPGVLTNDTDVDSGGLTTTLASGPAHGTLVLNANGSFTYTPELNYSGADSFEYTVSDGQGGSDTATVSLTVNAVNDAPDAQDDAYEVLEDGLLMVAAPGVLDNDSDVDSALSAELLSDVLHGTLILDDDGSFIYAPDADFNGTDSFTYRVNDGEFTDTATVTITVVADNEAPVAVDDSATTAEDTTLSIAVLANDADVDGDVLTVTDFDQGAHGTVSLNEDGTLLYVPELNFFGTDSFEYTVGDGEFIDTGLVTITVTPVNDAPVAGDDTATTDQDVAVTIAVGANDVDVDGDTLTVASVTQGVNGAVSINEDGTVTYTPNAGFSGNDSFEYTVSDGQGGSDTGLVTVTVNATGGNDAPVFTEIADRTITEGQELRFFVSATDADDPAGSLIYSVTSGLPAGATFNAATREFVWVPADNTVATVTFTVLDDEGASDTMEVVLTATNVKATVYAGADQVVGLQRVEHDCDDDKEATVSILASFNDLGTLDTHTAKIDWGDCTDPAAGAVSEAGANGTVTGSHTYKKAGVYTVKVTVTDDDGASRTDTLTVTVKDPNRHLRARADDYKLVEDGVLQVNATNGVLRNDYAPGGAPLQARLVEGPDHGALSFNADGSFTYRPDANFHGKDTFWYEFTDGNNVSRAMEVELWVKDDGRREACIDWGGRSGWSHHFGKHANFVEFLVKLARRFD